MRFKVVTVHFLPVCVRSVTLQCVSSVTAVSTVSDTYFPKFSPSSSVSGRSALAVSGRNVHSRAPTSGNNPNVRGGTNMPNMLCNRKERKVKHENVLISEYIQRSGRTDVYM